MTDRIQEPSLDEEVALLRAAIRRCQAGDPLLAKLARSVRELVDQARSGASAEQALEDAHLP